MAEGLESDRLFARLLVERGLLSAEVAEACLRDLVALTAPDGAPVRRLQDLLIERRLLGADSFRGIAPDAVAPAGRFGRYELDREIGRGGMAVVYRARQVELDRPVALKVLRDAQGAGLHLLERFHREALAVAKLRHPNIVAVYDAGRVDGTPYLAMELVDGVPLDKSVPRTLRERVLAAAKVAEALDHAHRHGVIHRDIKPSNILVDRAGEPRVVDFGLAHLGQMSRALTRSGAVMGTPLYMSPEQVRGDVRATGPRSDIWSVGVVLYQMLTGRLPFNGARPETVYRAILLDDPERPRAADPGVPADLETVCLKALEKDPARRYATAGDLAADLHRWLQGEPIAARPVSTVRRLGRKLVRRRGVVAAFSAAAVAFVAALLIVVPRWRAAEARRASAERALRLWGSLSNLLTEAELASRDGDAVRMRRKLDEGIDICRASLRADDFAHAHYFLGRFFGALGRTEDAERELGLALAMDSELGEARFERGLLRVLTYQRLILYHCTGQQGPRSVPTDELEREHPELRDLRERTLEDLAIDVGRSSYFRRVDGLFGRAQMDRLRGARESAERGFHLVLEEDPRYAAALVGLAFLAHAEGRRADAIECCTRAIEKHRGLAAAYAVRIMVRDANDHEAIAADAAKAIELGEDLPFIYEARAIAALRMGERLFAEGGSARDLFLLAVDDFDRVQERVGDRAFVLNNRALARLNLGQAEARTGQDPRRTYERAVVDVERALKIHPGFPPAVNTRAYALFLDGEELIRRGEDPRPSYRRALSELDRAVELEPGESSHWGSRGNTHRVLGEAEAACGNDPGPSLTRAISDFGEALLRKPDATVHHQRAMALMAQAEARDVRPQEQRALLERAIADLDAAVQLDPRISYLYNTRASVYVRIAEAGDRLSEDAAKCFQRALDDFDRALQIRPQYAFALNNRAGVRITLGEVAFRRGGASRPSFQRALQDLDRAIEINADYAAALANRGVVRILLGDEAGADEDVRRAMQLDAGLRQSLPSGIENARLLARRYAGSGE